MNALPVYDARYIKTKVRTYGDKVYTNFRALNKSGDYTKFEYFTVLYIDSLLVYEHKYYLHVYLDNCAYKIKARLSSSKKNSFYLLQSKPFKNDE